MIRWLALLCLCGCPAPRSRCDANTASQVELRDGKGALLLAAKPGEKGTTDVCDGLLQRVASVKLEGATAVLLDRGGAPRMNLRRNGPDDLEASGADNQPRLRVHRDGKELHVMEPSGIRLGTVALGDGKATLYNRQQVPSGTVEPRGADQAIRDPEGTTLYLVQPAASSQTAGVFSVAGLDPQEQLVLYLLLSR